MDEVLPILKKVKSVSLWINERLTKCKNICRLLIESAIILTQFSETVFDCIMIDIKSWIVDLAFPGTLEVLKGWQCMVQAWMFVC
jgi:hypothetical protein